MENDNLLSFRLRSLRSRKRIVKKDVEKQIRKKYKRSKELWKIKRDIPWIPLEEPYQRGFVRFFAVTEEVMRTKDAEFFEGILKKINTFMYSEIRHFLKKKRKFGRRIYVEREQKLKSLSSYEWDNPKIQFTARERQYFLKRREYCPFRKMYYDYCDFIEPWRFTLRIKPNMITHYKPVNAELEKEYAEVEFYVKQYKVQGIIQKKIYGKSNSWKIKYESDLNESKKYFLYNMSATAFADYFMDE
ncbi:hypothetical protein J3D55_000175 [Chryseobacterium ginsenosidimutans]|uniref:hypothetical protein n=1 Tax=Chryseobacterium ginsenosidimutans TaxID=687846 RepID=UPI002169B3D8|nr:hypothetical protein [Chryseobacterium ginsenosidimutans]MCS3867259.1 hypothetical protein [Chryseobacterium ginsenosidimutans]